MKFREVPLNSVFKIYKNSHQYFQKLPKIFANRDGITDLFNSVSLPKDSHNLDEMQFLAFIKDDDEIFSVISFDYWAKY